MFTAQGVTRTWDGGGADNNWNTPANWSGDTVPTSSDTAVFDSTSTKNCTINVTLTGGSAPAGISINTGYTGTITQASGVSVTIGSSGFSQAVGTFTGGDSAITINGTYTLSGGTFTSTSGTFQVGRNTNGIDEIFFTISGGNFNHNNGTVSFVDYSSTGCSSPRTQTVDVATSLTLYNIIINAPTNECGYPNKMTTASGDTIIATNNFTQTDGYILGTWEVQGNVIVASTADGGDATLTYTGTGAKTYTYTAGGAGPHLKVNTATGWLSPNAGTTDLTVSLFSLLSGTFVAPTGTMQVGRDSNGIDETFFTVSGGTFNHNNGTVNLVGYTSAGCSGTKTFTVDVATSLTLYNVIANTGHTACGYTNRLTTGAGDTIIVAGNFTHTIGALLGTWEVKGNITIGATADGGTATLSLTGTSDQTYTDAGGNEPDGNITINKLVGTKVTLASNADWNAASQALTITSGILDIGAYNLYTGGTLTVGASGVLHDYSTGDIILGGNVSNSGIIRLESSGSCGSTDSISITSSSGGTQRAWSGSGIYTLWDTSIQDQGGTAKIQVNSGTSVSGNGTNFVFNSGCNFANNTSSLTSGLVGYWPMEENSGTSTADMSGQGNNGTLTNGPTWTTGKIGNAVSFDGNNDYIDLGTSYNNLSGMTVSYWIKLNSLPSSSYMPIAKSASWGVWRTAISSSGSVTYVVQTTNNVWYSAGTSANSVASAVQVGQWTLVTGTYDGSYVRVYVNGVLKGTGSQAISGNIYDANPQSVYIGHQDYGQFTQGAIDEVRIYNRALSATEVQQLYNNVRPSAVSIPSSKITIPSGKVNFAY